LAICITMVSLHIIHKVLMIKYIAVMMTEGGNRNNPD